MLSLKENSWWKLLREVFYIFCYRKVNWIEHNQALCSMNFFSSHFVNISLTTLFNPATGSWPFLCKPRVLTMYWNCMKTEPAEERKSHSSECMASVSVCLGEPPEAASAILTLALFLELSRSLVDSGYLARWKHPFSFLEHWCAHSFKSILSSSWTTIGQLLLPPDCPSVAPSLWYPIDNLHISPLLWGFKHWSAFMDSTQVKSFRYKVHSW